MGNIALKSDLVNKHRVWKLFVVIALSWVPALIDADSVRRVANLYAVAIENPYFLPEYAFSLYFWTPIVVISGCFLFLSPGLFVSIALGSAKSVGKWIFFSFFLSLIIISASTAIVQSFLGFPLRGQAFACVVIGCALLAYGFLLLRVTQGHLLSWPITKPSEGVTILCLVLVPALLLVALAPKFYWENFNGDGAHSFETARLLFTQPFPFWPSDAGSIAEFPGTTSMLFAFPMSWFVRLFGETEASARLPILLLIPTLYCIILTIAEDGRKEALSLPERSLIWLGLVTYFIVMAFSATYNPYSADIADPSIHDTLLMICFLAFVFCFDKASTLCTVALIFLTYFTRPSGILLIGLYLLTTFLLFKPRPARQIGIGTIALMGCLFFSAVFPKILTFFNHPLPGSEHGIIGLLKPFAFLQFTDWRRVAYLIVPCGIMPVIAIFRWPWQDRVTKTLAVVSITYFVIFYVQAHISLHHFVPSMVLPLAVFWRDKRFRLPKSKRLFLSSYAILGIIALVLSLPRNAAPYTAVRTIAHTIDDKLGGYDTFDPRVFKRAELLRVIIPDDANPAVPRESYGEYPNVWPFYVHKRKTDREKINYVMQSSTDPSPNGMRLVSSENGVSLYILDEVIWENHLAMRPPTPAGSKIYHISRGILLRTVPLDDCQQVISLIEIMQRMGVDPIVIMEKLGVDTASFKDRLEVNCKE